MRTIGRRMAFALVTAVAMPACSVAQSVEISIDATLARTLIEAVCSGTDVSRPEIEDNPLIRAQLIHHRRLGDEYTLENYLSGLESASRCEAPSPDPFRFGELVRRKDEIESSIDFLIENRADIAATVERLVRPYVPEDFSFRGGVVLSVAGSSCGGFAVDQAFFVDIPCLGPDVRSDYVALKYIIAHETYHAVQDLFVPPNDLEPQEVSTLPEAYSFLFHELVREGMAEYVADFGEVEEGGPYTAIFTGFTRRNRSRLRWNFMLLDYLVELLGYRVEELGTRLADVYDIGFRGDLDQLFYHVGARIAEVIEADFGRAALVCVTSLAPEQFILAYTGALEDGTSVSGAHPPGRSVLAAATSLAGAEANAWRRCLPSRG